MPIHSRSDQIPITEEIYRRMKEKKQKLSLIKMAEESGLTATVIAKVCKRTKITINAAYFITLCKYTGVKCPIELEKKDESSKIEKDLLAQKIQEYIQKMIPKEKVRVKFLGTKHYFFEVTLETSAGNVVLDWTASASHFETEQAIYNESKTMLRWALKKLVRQKAV